MRTLEEIMKDVMAEESRAKISVADNADVRLAILLLTETLIVKTTLEQENDHEGD